MQNRENPQAKNWGTLGLAIAGLGLLVSMLTLVPGVVPNTMFPWPLFVGAFIYFPGAFLLFFAAKRQGNRKNMLYLRFIRLGFAAVLLIFIIQMVSSGPAGS
jgi:hypothetical protein